MPVTHIVTAGMGGMRTAGDLVAWMESRMELTVDQPKETYMGIRNTASTPKCFYVVFDCDNTVTQSTTATTGCGMMQLEKKVGCDWFNTLTALELDGGETKVLPVSIEAGTAHPDT